MVQIILYIQIYENIFKNSEKSFQYGEILHTQKVVCRNLKKLSNNVNIFRQSGNKSDTPNL